MAVHKYVIFVYLTLSFLCNVLCDLNLKENEPCVAEGVNGTCVGIYRCPTASLTYDYANAGFLPKPRVRYGVAHSISYPKLPEICSYKNNQPVVCCTDCEIFKKPFESLLLGPHAHSPYPESAPAQRSSDLPISQKKCYEYFKRLPFMCRGEAAFSVFKDWNEDMKCHDYGQAWPLVSSGRNAQRWEFAHVALIGYGNNVDTAEWLCGGSVISERFILTAAHCTSTGKRGNITFAALGLLKRTDPKKYWKIYNIKRIIIHPDYKSPSKYDDIALLETETEINFGRDLLPACLHPGYRSKYGLTEVSEAAGWGKLGAYKELADTLQIGILKRFSATECSKIYKPNRHLIHGYDEEKQMCYGSHHASVDTCEGDSGGPLHVPEHDCLYHIVGVTSFGKKCGMLGSAGIYTRVSYYVPWIESIVWPEETEAKRNTDQEWLDKLFRNV